MSEFQDFLKEQLQDDEFKKEWEDIQPEMEGTQMYYELQPLRIQEGWRIEYNNFTEYDMDIHGVDDLFELHEDLIQLRHMSGKLIIDLGWYPSYEIDGKYLLLLVKNFDWDNPLEQVSTKSKKEIIACIEKWVCRGFFEKYL